MDLENLTPEEVDAICARVELSALRNAEAAAAAKETSSPSESYWAGSAWAQGVRDYNSGRCKIVKDGR